MRVGGQSAPPGLTERCGATSTHPHPGVRGCAGRPDGLAHHVPREVGLRDPRLWVAPTQLRFTLVATCPKSVRLRSTPPTRARGWGMPEEVSMRECMCV